MLLPPDERTGLGVTASRTRTGGLSTPVTAEKTFTDAPALFRKTTGADVFPDCRAMRAAASSPISPPDAFVRYRRTLARA